MEVGDRIQCWSTHEMYKKMMEYAREGIMTDIVNGKKNCLVVKEIRKRQGKLE